jgi:hypothetical protein
MVAELRGPLNWSGGSDEEGHRTYKLTWLVKTSTPNDGPAIVYNTPGLPRPGAFWQIGNDVDIYAWRRPNMTIAEYSKKDGDPHQWWTVEQTYSTKPIDRDKQRCQDTQIQDPILEPMKVRGEFTLTQEEATHDRFGVRLTSSSWEQLRGTQVEWPKNRAVINIEQNVLYLGVEVFTPMIGTVNVFPLWGLPKRCIRLANVRWERKYWGLCRKYYTRTLEFECDAGTFDRNILDEGTKVLNGHWDRVTGNWINDKIGGGPPNPNNPAHFIRFKDRQGENAHVILDGAGNPYVPDAPKVITCSICAEGAPQFWDLRGFTGANKKYNMRLTYQLNCVWTGSPNNDPAQGTVRLDNDAGTNTWKLTNNNLFSTWSLPNEDWSCMVYNQLKRDEAVGGLADDGPKTLTIIPGGTNLPGSRYVEKLDESNFLLLNIPTTF